MPAEPLAATSAIAIDAIPAGFIRILTQLVRSPSVTGAEHCFFRVLQRELEERGAQISWYEGLLVAHGDRPRSMMFSAHIDRHGLICTGPNEFQYAAFVAGARSDLLGNSVSEQLMRKIVDRFAGDHVYAYEPWSGSYRGRGQITNAFICDQRNNLIFEVDGLDHLVAGTPVAFEDNLKITDKALIGQLDNVFSAALLVYLFERGFRGTAFFTAQEEAGKSWRYLLEWFRRFGASTNELIVLDTSPFPDFEAAAAQDLVLRFQDANARFSDDLTQSVADLCHQQGHRIVFKDRYVEAENLRLAQLNEPPRTLGSTELGRIIRASNGLVDGTSLQIPTSGYHTLEEAAPLAAVRAFIEISERLAGI